MTIAKLKEKNVMMFTRGMDLGGTENVVLELCEILSPNVNKIVVCSMGGVMVKKLSQMQITHYCIPDIADHSFRNLINIIKCLDIIIREEGINIIHVHHRMAAFYTMLMRLKYNITFLATAHTSFKDKKILSKIAYRGCNIIACGKNVKINLVNLYNINEKNITVIHNAVKEFNDKITLIERLQNYRRAGNLLVGNVSRIDSVKGIDVFLKAAAAVKKSLPNTKFIIVGDGDEKKEMERLSENLGIENDVWFMGYQSNVRSIISQMDLMVLSSWMEGLPLSPIESFSVKKTIVGTDTEGTMEIVKNNYNGFIVKKGDYVTMAERIIELLRNDELRYIFSSRAYNTFQKNFSYEAFSKKIISYYMDRGQ